ncbi:MAG: hypothetical protein GXO87_01860 [Chlorobi bacterium]|nr:hypothetical protein [Chlorobiota bacterium]
MIKKIFSILLIVPFLLFAQEKKDNQSIELPDFVITGVQNVKIPKQKKKKAKLVNILSESFFRPSISSEALSVAAFSQPEILSALKEKKPRYFNGRARAGAGLYALPVGAFSYYYPIENGILFADLKGINVRDYVDNAGYNRAYFGVGGKFFIGRNSSFLPKAAVNIKSDYWRSAYKFFGSANPTQERKPEKVSANLSIKNLTENSFGYEIKTDFKKLTFKENDFSESVFDGELLFNFGGKILSASVEGNFKSQSLKNNFSGFDSYNSFSGKFNLKYKLSESVDLFGGLMYAAQDTQYIFMPTAAIGIKLNKYFYLFGEFAPYADFETQDDFLQTNRFFQNTNVDNNFTIYKNFIHGGAKYQYDKYFEISGGVKYSRVSNYLYFEDSVQPGVFLPQIVDDVKEFTVYANFLYHRGPFGYFYGTVNFQNVKFENGFDIPYRPMIEATLTYGDDIFSKIGYKINFDFRAETYTDAANQNKIPSYVNLGFLLEYRLTRNFALTANLQNLLFKENYYFNNYQEKTFDVLFGIDYKF